MLGGVISFCVLLDYMIRYFIDSPLNIGLTTELVTRLFFFDLILLTRMIIYIILMIDERSALELNPISILNIRVKRVADTRIKSDYEACIDCKPFYFVLYK